MEISQENTNQNKESIYKKYWFHALSILWLIVTTIYLVYIARYVFIDGLIFVFFPSVAIWLILFGLKTKRFLLTIRSLIILSVIAFYLSGFYLLILGPLMYVPLLGEVLVAYFMYLLYFLWCIPINKESYELYNASHKIHFFIKFAIIILTGIPLLYFSILVAGGIS